MIDSKIGSESFFLDAEGSRNSILEVDGLTLQNVSLDYGNWIIHFTTFCNVSLGDIHISQIHTLNYTQSSDILVSIKYSEVIKSTEVTLRDVVIEDSNLEIFRIENYIHHCSIQHPFLAQNITYKSSELSAKNTLIRIVDMSDCPGYSITLQEVSFIDVKFREEGYLISLSRHEIVPVIVEGLRLQNVTNGIVVVIEDSPIIHFDEHPQVLFSNTTAVDCYCGERSLFDIAGNSEITIQSSTFQNVSTTGKGSVIHAHDQGQALIYDSKFLGNIGFQGGVFMSQERSLIKVYYSTIQNNSAIISGVFAVFDLGAIEIHHTMLLNNMAMANPVGSIFNSKIESVIANITLDQNLVVPPSIFLNLIEPLNIIDKYEEFIWRNKEEIFKLQAYLSISVAYSNIILAN